MKILSYAWTIYDERISEFKSNCTGGGLVVKNLCEYLGRDNDSFLFVGQRVLPAMKLDHINIVKTNYDATISKSNINEHIKYMTQIFEDAIKKISPDIVHFHDDGDLAYSIITNVCIPLKIQFCMTYHLYIGKNPPFSGYEKSILDEERSLSLPSLNLITVSSGMKQKILKDYPDKVNMSITPILNGTDFNAELICSDWKERLNIGDRKILICAGTICYRKNQLQILDVFEKNRELASDAYVIFCGRTALHFDSDFDYEIKKRGLDNCMSYIGPVNGITMKALYTISDGLIMPSYSEGLSIAALEAISYGKPVIMFKSSECALDLASEEMVSFAKDNSDEALKQSIDDWLHRKWNSEEIRSYASNFSMERMAFDYVQYYKKLLTKNI